MGGALYMLAEEGAGAGTLLLHSTPKEHPVCLCTPSTSSSEQQATSLESLAISDTRRTSRMRSIVCYMRHEARERVGAYSSKL